MTVRRDLGLVAMLAIVAACNSGEGTPGPGDVNSMAGAAAGIGLTAGAGAGTAPAAGTLATAGTAAAGTSAGATAIAGTTATAGSGTNAGSGANAGMGTPAGVGALAGMGASAGMGGDLPAATGNPISAECQGFSFEGLIYSPGGDVPPNKCEAFHPTLNNPYAVRCVDAWPWYETSYPGDEYCILPPPPDKGVQIGMHPQGPKWFEQVSVGDMSGYESPSDPWLMATGEEEEVNFHTRADNTAEGRYYRNAVRMRAGSHHMIVSTGGAGDETWAPGSALGLFGGTGLPGAQRPDENAPRSLDKPPEDAGLFSVIPAAPPVTYNVHHFNVTGETTLKESWTNLWWEDDARVRVHGILGLELAQVFTLAVSPGASLDLHYAWNITQPVRVVSLFGHRHAWTTNFTAWVQKADGQSDILYQSFDWYDMPTYRYDSVTQNPMPSKERLIDGATSGVQTLNPGEQLHFNCHIEFTEQRAASEDAPMPSSVGTLGFANEAYTGEMCILFGTTAEVELGRPTRRSDAPPAFAQ